MNFPIRYHRKSWLIKCPLGSIDLYWWWNLDKRTMIDHFTKMYAQLIHMAQQQTLLTDRNSTAYRLSTENFQVIAIQMIAQNGSWFQDFSPWPMISKKCQSFFNLKISFNKKETIAGWTEICEITRKKDSYLGAKVNFRPNLV